MRSFFRGEWIPVIKRRRKVSKCKRCNGRGYYNVIVNGQMILRGCKRCQRKEIKHMLKKRARVTC